MSRLAHVGMAAVIMMGLLVAGCHMGNPTTRTDRVTIGKGENLQCYQLVNVDSQGRAEFRNIDTGEKDIFAHILAAPGQFFGLEKESNHRTRYQFDIESTDPAKQQATIRVKTTEY